MYIYKGYTLSVNSITTMTVMTIKLEGDWTGLKHLNFLFVQNKEVE